MAAKKRRTQAELSTNDQIFKTTIVFKGVCKKLAVQLGHNKSHIVGAVLADAIRSGKIKDFLSEHYSDDEIIKMINIEDTPSAQKKERELRIETNSPVRANAKETTEIDKKGTSHGFDF